MFQCPEQIAFSVSLIASMIILESSPIANMVIPFRPLAMANLILSLTAIALVVITEFSHVISNIIKSCLL